jgi:protein translocase SecG subunit
MDTFILVLVALTALVFTVLVLITGKGDAMSGGGSVRTTYKGKATFDDIMSKATLYCGVAWMVLVLLYQVIRRPSDSFKAPVTPSASVETNLPAATAPTSGTNAPAANTPAPATNTPATNSPANNAPAPK